jgi:hypothetical protein
VEATTEQLLAALAQKLGEQEVNTQWLGLQLTATRAQLAAAELECAGLTSRVLGMEAERGPLVARLQALEPAPAPAQTRRRARTRGP